MQVVPAHYQLYIGIWRDSKNIMFARKLWHALLLKSQLTSSIE